MIEKTLVEPEAVRHAVEVLHQGRPFEVRIIPNQGKRTASGYFANADKLLEELRKRRDLLEDANVYITINEIHPGCFSRYQRERFVEYPKVTTSDRDIIRRRWILLDFDPDRPAGISSSEEELQAALRRRDEVYQFLKNQGQGAGVLRAISGNGGHLLIPVDLPNTEETEEQTRSIINGFAEKFSDGLIKVDVTVFNAARVCKLYGTRAQKGSDTPERPHRMSALEVVPDE